MSSPVRRPLAQLVLCRGCCCGRADKGRPELPAERLAEVWKAESLGRTVQLTVSGCLGPCELANVAVVLSAGGAEWVGGMSGDAVYAAAVEWARACDRDGRLHPLPAEFAPGRFDRFADAEGVT
jgi:hypothetical protein